MTEKPEASVLTARRAAQHFRLSSADDACEHLYILIVRSSLGPSPPHAGRYTVASRFRRRSCERGYIFQGLQNSSLPPRSALWATCDGTHGLIEFLLSRQSFSAALQVADKSSRIAALRLRISFGASTFAMRPMNLALAVTNAFRSNNV